jgi:GT2 family glycosyltransferase
MYLEKCLTSLLKQIHDAQTKIIVVDNASTDNTKKLVDSLINQDVPVEYHYESRQGLSIARNTGWQQAGTEWLFYIDDDCLAPENFIANTLSIINNFPAYDVFGGPIEALYTIPKPDWLPDGFGNFKIDAADVKKLDRGYLRGGCLLIKRKVLESIGGFNEAFGMKGSSLGYAEELELQDRIRTAGYTIAYAPDLHIYHFVRPDKLSVAWVMASEYARRRDKMMIEHVSIPRASMKLARTIMSRFFWMPVNLVSAIFKKDESLKKALVKSMLPLLYRLGEWRGSLKRNKR